MNNDSRDGNFFIEFGSMKSSKTFLVRIYKIKILQS